MLRAFFLAFKMKNLGYFKLLRECSIYLNSSCWYFHISKRINNITTSNTGIYSIPCNHIYQALRSGRIWYKVNFLSGFQQVWIQSFSSPTLVASPRLKNTACPTNNWSHTFPTGISAMCNTISLVQDLNSCRRVHFLWR